MKKLIVVCFVFICSLFAQTDESYSTNEKVSLQLKWLHQFQFAGYYAAKEKGFYSDVGLDVTIRERNISQNNVEQVIKGESEYGISDSALLLYRAKGEPVVLVSAILQHSPSVLVTLKSSNIETPYNLDNKKILFYKNEVDGIGIFAMLNAMRITADTSFTRVGVDYQALIDGKVDAYTGYVTNEIFYLKQKNIPINIIDPTNYGFDFYGDMLFTNEFEAKNHPDRVKRFNEATLKGWKYALANKEEMITLIKNKYAQNKSIEHLRYEADALEQLIQNKSIPLGTIDKGRLSYIANVYKKYGLMKNEIDMDRYVFESNNNIYQKNYTKNGNLLSNKEIVYLKNKKQIAMCVDPDWMPFEKIDKGQHIGMSADYIEILQKKLQIKIALVPTKNWIETLSYAQERKCDILSLVIPTASRRAYLDFTKSYLDVPLVVVSKNENIFTDDPTQIRKKLGIVKGYAYGEILRNKYPKMQIVDVQNVKEGMDKVSNGELFGFIGTLATTAYEMQSHYIGYLKIIGKFDESMALGVGVRNDEPILKEIFDKAIDSITQEQKQNILNKWLSINFVKENNIVEIIQWVLLIVTISIVIIYFILKKNAQLSNEIISRKSIEKELEDTLELFNLGETILFKWKNDNVWSIEYSSQNTKNVLGYNKSEFMSEDIRYSDLIHEEDINRVLDEVHQNIKKDSFVHKPYRVRTLNKDYIWVSDTTKIIKDQYGNVTYFLGYIRDITKEINQQSELEISHQNLLKSEKLAALGQLLANIAHEINSPLGAIKSSVESASTELSYFISNYSNVVKSFTHNEEKIFTNIVDKIIANNEFVSSAQERIFKKETMSFLKEKNLENPRIVSDKLTRLQIYNKNEIEDVFPLLLHSNRDEIFKMLLVISKLYTSNHNIKEAINSSTKTILALKSYAHSVDDTKSVTLKPLKESLDTVLTIYNNKLKYNVNLIYEVEELAPIEANHDELMQVWTNIIHNALYAMDNQGDLIIKAYVQNSTQVVEITDSGVGMTNEIKEKIFDPFFTTKPTGVGSGLGLDIIQNIILKLDGKIEVESEVGVGTTFRVILPF